MKTLFLLIFLTFALFANSQEKAFIDMMHYKYGFSKAYIKRVLDSAKFVDYSLKRYDGRLKGATDYPWSRYKSKIFIPQSIELGKRFMRKYSYYLNKASKRFNVNKEIITAFIRIESKFGLYGNEFRVIDVLKTLAFNKNRKQRYFKRELKSLFLMARAAKVDILSLRGSFAGAMGCVQQMPSIYLKYAVDLDENGVKNPNSMADCIGSIAKFLRKNGWSNSRVTITEAKVRGDGYLSLRSSYKSLYSLSTLKAYGIYPKEPLYTKKAYFLRLYNGNSYDIFLGDRNYRVITFYNPSKQYGVSVALYAKKLSE